MVVLVLIDGGFHRYLNVVEWEGRWVGPPHETDRRTDTGTANTDQAGRCVSVCLSQLAWFPRSSETVLYNNQNLNLSTIQWLHLLHKHHEPIELLIMF